MRQVELKTLSSDSVHRTVNQLVRLFFTRKGTAVGNVIGNYVEKPHMIAIITVELKIVREHELCGKHEEDY